MSSESVLFVCTHNSARSQMAEGLLRARRGSGYKAFSAGTEPSRVHPMSIRVMKEIGIDISKNRSEHVDKYSAKQMDFVVTVCDSARETCPYVPASKLNMHHAFSDPSRVAKSDEARLEAFRRVRDEIDSWIQLTFAN